jgi:hypothetical protein
MDLVLLGLRAASVIPLGESTRFSAVLEIQGGVGPLLL